MKRKIELVNNSVYHIYNRSIAKFKIFNSDYDYIRILAMLKYYRLDNLLLKFSKFIKLNNVQNGFNQALNKLSSTRELMVDVLAYCIMPTHIHFILMQKKDNGISNFMGNLQNSYSRYFNTKYKRKGPLWEGKFQNVLVDKDEQLLHLTRYIHLNPCSADLVDKPELWEASSYNEYLQKVNSDERICNYQDLLEIKPASYKKFVDDRKAYQRELAIIKNVILEEY